MKRIYFIVVISGLWLGGALPLFSQYVPTHITNEGIYLFLDELATKKVIDLCSLVKPYSRQTIAEKLRKADSLRTGLSSRQQSELDFYLKDYMKELPGPDPHVRATSWFWQKNHGNKRFDVFHYRDSLFQITVNPILGSDVWVNSNGSFYHWWNGVEAWSCAGRFGIWASLRDNHESVELTARDFQNQRTGGSNFKIFSGGKRDYWELRGGITYAWDWGHVGLIMGQFAWGENNAGSNIYSGRTPAFPRIELSMDPVDWFRFTYVHGALISEVVDSSLSFYTTTAYGTDYREVYHPKYLAANLFTFIPWTGLQLSVGNSVVYDYRHPHAAFLLPVAFYKAIDHTLNARIDNMNSQLFLSVSSRNLRDFHFYGTVFLDEVAVDRIFDRQEFNFVSYKAGLATTILPDARIVAEYTWTNALTFMHNIPTTTFESNQYNLGHYLEDNAKDLYVGIAYRPFRTLNIKSYINHAVKGPDHTEMGTDRLGIVPFDPIVWKSVRFGLLANLQVINDLCIRLGYEWRDVTGEQEYLDRWTPEVYHGQTGTVRIGVNFGF
ncbi:MAG: hypothetical protein KAR19_11840 [Bacteroidales bacterium]|nr:hypothetical protein [Bacteroidales bacterium]